MSHNLDAAFGVRHDRRQRLADEEHHCVGNDRRGEQHHAYRHVREHSSIHENNCTGPVQALVPHSALGHVVVLSEFGDAVVADLHV